MAEEFKSDTSFIIYLFCMTPKELISINFIFYEFQESSKVLIFV